MKRLTLVLFFASCSTPPVAATPVIPTVPDPDAPVGTLMVGISPASIELVPEASVPVLVSVERDRVVGPLDVVATDLPRGLSVEPSILPESSGSVGIQIAADGTVEPGRPPATLTLTVSNDEVSASIGLEVRFPEIEGGAGYEPLVELLLGGGEGVGGDLAFDSQGRIVVSVTERQGGSDTGWVFRVLPVGLLDPAFGFGGTLEIEGILRNLVVTDDGVTLQGFEYRTGPQFLWRFDPAGNFAAGFVEATEPVVSTSSREVRDLFVDGQHLVFADIDRVLRFDLDGNEDTAVRYVSDPMGSVVTAAPDGRGGAFVSVYDAQLAEMAIDRIDANGSPVSNFADEGRLVLESSLPHQGIWGLVPEAGGAIAVSIVARENGSGSGVEMFRFDDRGTIDPTFGTNGVVEIIDGAGTLHPPRILRVGQHVVVAGGPLDDETSSVAHRFSLDGVLDETFGTAGTVALPGWPTGLALDPSTGQVAVVVLSEVEARVELGRLPP